MPQLLVGIAVIVVIASFAMLVIDWLNALFEGGDAILLVRGLSWPFFGLAVSGMILYGLGANWGITQPWNL
jgi:hypothetical protein